MPVPPRTARQIAEKYKGNLSYFRKPHALRTLRAIFFALAVVGSLAAAIGFRHFGGKKSFFNPRPISANHAKFADRCEVCHEDAHDDLAEVLRLREIAAGFTRADAATGDRLLAKAREAWPALAGTVAALPAKLSAESAPERARAALSSLQQTALAGSTLTHLDVSCVKCHAAQGLHQPQAAALGLRSALRELPLVHAGACSTCHREHAGAQTMKLPGSSSCASCHNRPEQLAATLSLVKNPAVPAAPHGETRDVGDGLRRFLAPRAEPHRPVAFASFEQGHPPFGYENPAARDPAAIRFNHRRHAQPDIPRLDGRTLDCADCHKPGGGGAFMQPVSFEVHCARCHSLHFDPDVARLAIPHGDPEKVRAFLRSLTGQYVDYAVRERHIADRPQLELFVRTQFDKLRARGIGTAEELDRRVFFTGDPPEDPSRITTKSNKGQFFQACAKCHDVTPAAVTGAPRIAATNIAERWITRGPFSHQPHAHMSCADCHGTAAASAKTSDILLPAQASCVACHRPLEVTSAPPVQFIAAHDARDAVERQRREGGVLSDCRSCHRFHASPDAAAVLKAAR